MEQERELAILYFADLLIMTLVDIISTQGDSAVLVWTGTERLGIQNCLCYKGS